VRRYKFFDLVNETLEIISRVPRNDCAATTGELVCSPHAGDSTMRAASNANTLRKCAFVQICSDVEISDCLQTCVSGKSEYARSERRPKEETRNRVAPQSIPASNFGCIKRTVLPRMRVSCAINITLRHNM